MKKESVKAQASIITIVLIILVSLVAVIIVWNVVNGVMKKSTSQVDVDSFALKGEVAYSLSSDKSSADVSVFRPAGGSSVSVSGIKLVFEDTDGLLHIYEDYSIYPGELETKFYSIKSTDLNPRLDSFSKLKKISLYYVYIKDGKNVTTGIEITTSTKPAPNNVTNPNNPPTNTYNPVVCNATFDIDGDHYGNASSGCLGLDCNDNNNRAWVNMSLYADIDSDGYGFGSQMVYCLNGTVPFGNSTIGDDCNDTSSVQRPNATEILNNELDENCDGYGDINSCMTLRSSNKAYKLTDNILNVPADSNCIEFSTGTNITLDLNDKSIVGTCRIEPYPNCDTNWACSYTNQSSCISNNCSWNSGSCSPNYNCWNYYGNATACVQNNCTLFYSEDMVQSQYGIYGRYSVSNISVINGKITNFSFIIYLEQLKNGGIFNNLELSGCTNKYTWENATYIDYYSQGFYFSYSNRSVVTNIVLDGFSEGIFENYAYYNNISNININNFGRVIYLSYADMNSFKNINAGSPGYLPMYLYRAKSNIFSNIDIAKPKSNTNMMQVYYSDSNSFSNLTLCGNVTARNAKDIYSYTSNTNQYTAVRCNSSRIYTSGSTPAPTCSVSC
jgi:hypothetical protein